MAHYLTAAVGILVANPASALLTCPGFPGYCSESFPGQTCNVVCSFGRNNVPLCQEDGTWTDIPRCVEHEPGVDEQIPGLCPGISGYCSQGFLNQRCTFDCRTGADIDSLCSEDGTWQPYPVCDGDLRETRDGCDGCPGPAGGVRNRTAEEVLASRGQPAFDRRPNNRVPKVGSIDGVRKQIPSFAGNTRFGPISTQMKLERVNPENQFIVGNDGRIQQRQPQQQQRPQPQQPAQRQQNFQTRFQEQRPAAQPQRPQPAPRPQQPQPVRQQQPQQQFQQGLNTFQPSGQRNQPLGLSSGSLFDSIKNRINVGNRAKQQQQQQQQQQPQRQQQQPQRQQPQRQQPQPQRQPAPRPAAPRPAPAARPRVPLPIESFLPEISSGPQASQASAPSGNSFGIFESVNLGGSSQPQPIPAAPQPQPRSRPIQNDNFFGEFPTVNLQG